MVNLGRSKGCHTCKRRRIKCDEGKPTCRRCANSNLECEGYKPKKNFNVKFKDQTYAVAQRSKQPRKQSPKPVAVIMSSPEDPVFNIYNPLPEHEENLAFCFFLNNFAAPGREFDSSRGLFEIIIPTLSVSRPDSAVFLAFSAVAIEMFAYWRSGMVNRTGLPSIRLGQALERLQTALQDPVESQDPATLLATLLLQFNDNITSVRQLQAATRTHQNGALALARHMGPKKFETTHSNFMLLWILNVEVSSAIRENRGVPEDLDEWCKSDSVPRNPSGNLDRIGIAVAGVQRAFCHVWEHHTQCTNPSCLHRSLLSEIGVQAKMVESELDMWPTTLPAHWTPSKFDIRRLRNPKYVDVPTYLGTCEIYPTVQIASLWNAWRGYRLMIMNILLATMDDYNRIAMPATPSSAAPDNGKAEILERVQEVIDAVCASVPFHVGNRLKRSSIDEFDDEKVILPAYFHLGDDDVLPDQMTSTPVLSKEDHHRHVIAQGAWHMVNPIARILSLCMGPVGVLLTPAMRAGQLPWLRSQLLRLVKILALDQLGIESGGGVASPGASSQDSEEHYYEVGTRPEDFAEKLRESYRMAIGP